MKNKIWTLPFGGKMEGYYSPSGMEALYWILDTLSLSFSPLISRIYGGDNRLYAAKYF